VQNNRKRIGRNNFATQRNLQKRGTVGERGPFYEKKNLGATQYKTQEGGEVKKAGGGVLADDLS